MSDGSAVTAGRRGTHRALASMVRWDVRLQFRYGFYAAYAVLTVAYALALHVAPTAFRPSLLVLVVFNDPLVLGLYFVAALVLFEKGDGVLDALVTSPLSARAYLASKVASLSFLSVLASVVLAVASVGTAFDPLALVVGVGLTSALFVLLGFVLVARFDTLNAYFLVGTAALAPLGLPLLGTFGLVESPVWYAFPTYGTLVLLTGAFGAAHPAWELAYSVLYLCLWIGIAWVAAERAFERHVVRGRVRAEHGAARVRGRGRSSGRASPRHASAVADRLGPVGTLALADLRNWARDPLLLYVGFAPLLAAVVGRFLAPVATDLLAPWVDATPYYPLVVAVFLLLAPYLLGFVAGLFVLEERDQRVLEALWTTPLGGRGYIAYRGVAVMGLSVVLAFVAVPVLGLLAVPLWLLVPVALVSALWAAVGGLLLAAVATNSVEGVAVAKLFGVFLLVPLVAIPVVPGPVQFLAGLDPLYWPVKALVVGLAQGPVAEVWAFLAVGVVVHAAAIGVLVRRFRP